jgi:hypothetical protein
MKIPERDSEFRPVLEQYHILLSPDPLLVPSLKVWSAPLRSPEVRAFFRLISILYRYKSSGTTRISWTTRSLSIRLGTS